MRLLDGNLGGNSNRVLDVGCGTGTMVIHLRRYGCTFGVDVDHEAAGYCQERGIDTVVQAVAGHLPYADGAFELVTMLDVLEHIPDDHSALKEVARVAKPGGIVAIAVPAFRFLWGRQDEVSEHQRRYTARQLRAVVESAGLRVKRLTYFNTALFPPIALVRLARRVLPRPKTVQSDFNVPAPGPMNASLAAVFGLESALVARTNLPFGVSILCLAEK